MLQFKRQRRSRSKVIIEEERKGSLKETRQKNKKVGQAEPKDTQQEKGKNKKEEEEPTASSSSESQD